LDQQIGKSNEIIQLVRPDDVCIHIVGLPATLTKDTAFSSVYGVVDHPQVLHIPNTDLEFFVSDGRFYHRDQLLPIEGPLKGLGVNYHGDLRLTADRTEIVQRHPLFRKYRQKLKIALDVVIGDSPELALHIMNSFLVAEDGRFMPQPGSTARASQYRLAFEEASRALRPELFQHGQTVSPFPRSRCSEDERLIREMGFVPWPLADWQMLLLEQSGAFISPTKYSEKLLLASAPVPKQKLFGMDLFERCLRHLASELCDVAVVTYSHLRPRCVCRDGNVFLAMPKVCSRCVGGKCLCWIGPTLIRVMEHLSDAQDVDLEQIFEVYNSESGINDVPMINSGLQEVKSEPGTPAVGVMGLDENNTANCSTSVQSLSSAAALQKWFTHNWLRNFRWEWRK
jgi:hypothetical protein